jgi:hypothetical protein
VERSRTRCRQNQRNEEAEIARKLWIELKYVMILLDNVILYINANIIAVMKNIGMKIQHEQSLQ